jgi:hypothetical protein
MVLTTILKAPHFEDRSSLVLEELIKIKKGQQWEGAKRKSRKAQNKVKQEQER